MTAERIRKHGVPIEQTRDLPPGWPSGHKCIYLCKLTLSEDEDGNNIPGIDTSASGVFNRTDIGPFVATLDSGRVPKKDAELEVCSDQPATFFVRNSSYVVFWLSGSANYSTSQDGIQMVIPSNRYFDLLYFPHGASTPIPGPNTADDCQIAYFSAVVIEQYYQDSFKVVLSSPGRFTDLEVDPDIRNDGRPGILGKPPRTRRRKPAKSAPASAKRTLTPA